MKKIIYSAIIAASTFLLIQSCSKSGDKSNPDNGSSFDRKGMLTNMSTNIIIPAYNSFNTDVITLDAAVIAFTTAPDAGTLTAVQAAFKTTYQQWQSTSIYGFGPAEQEDLRVNINRYPTTVAQINANITSGTYNPDLLANLSAKGLPALDYLLFGTGADNNAILAKYTTDGEAANRKTYLVTLSAEIKTKVGKVTAAWNGAYKTTFVNATGTDVGSSVGQLVNQLVFDYEILKNYEIGIPAGTQSMGTTFPEKVQAYYSKTSVQLALLHIKAMQELYIGKDGLGLDDYLIKANAKYSDGKALNDVILNQFAVATAKLQGLNDPLSDQIKASPATVTAAYTELQKLTVLLKTDMTSALGILITYGDNDGD